MRNNIIGILGGMGAHSTAPFLEKLITKFQERTGAKHNIDFPHILIYSLPVPYYVGKAMDHAMISNTIYQGAKRLEDAGVSFIAMPCNGAHIYHSELQKRLKVPLLNMIEEAIKSLPQNKKLGLLCARNTIESQMYQNAFNSQNIIFFHDDKLQKDVDTFLQSIKEGKNTQILKAIWKSIDYKLKKNDVKVIFSACTDFNVFFNSHIIDYEIIDTSLYLIEAIINQWLEY